MRSLLHIIASNLLQKQESYVKFTVYAEAMAQANMNHNSKNQGADLGLFISDPVFPGVLEESVEELKGISGVLEPFDWWL